MVYILNRIIVFVAFWEVALLLPIVKSIAGGIPSRLFSTIRLQLHCAIYLPDSFALMLRYCVNLKAIRYESTSFNRIVADKSHRVHAA